MIKVSARRITRYLAEFVVIVLGVSLSFYAENWREEQNIRRNVELVVRDARVECKSYLTYGFHDKILRKKIQISSRIVRGEPVDNDSLLYLFEFIDIAKIQDLQSLFLLIDSDLYKDVYIEEQKAALLDLKFAVKYLDDLATGVEKYNSNLELLFQEYQIIDDLINIESEMTQNVIDSKERMPKIKATLGNYSGLLKDSKFTNNLKEVHRYLLFEKQARHWINVSMTAFINTADKK